MEAIPSAWVSEHLQLAKPMQLIHSVHMAWDRNKVLLFEALKPGIICYSSIT